MYQKRCLKCSWADVYKSDMVCVHCLLGVKDAKTCEKYSEGKPQTHVERKKRKRK